MDLVWLVYGISLLSNVGCSLTWLAIMSGIAIAVFLIYRGSECYEAGYYSPETNAKRVEQGKWAMSQVKTLSKFFITASLILMVLPSEKTAYMMVGAYATQKIAENDNVQETGSKVLKLINQKLDVYVNEGFAEIEKKAKQVTKEK
jgi:hypothetical protein